MPQPSGHSDLRAAEPTFAGDFRIKGKALARRDLAYLARLRDSEVKVREGRYLSGLL